MKDKELTERQKNIARLRKELNTPKENDVKVFTRYKIITYIFNILCPPYSLYRIWKKDSTFNNNEKFIQTMVCVIYMIFLVINIWRIYNG